MNNYEQQRKSKLAARCFGDFFDNNYMRRPSGTAPAINVLEGRNDYRVELAAPGMRKEDFRITINSEGDLEIQMEKRHNDSDSQKANEYRFLRREFNYTRFSQTLILPDDVDKEKIEAKMSDGVLTIILPKVREENDPKISHSINIE